MPLIKPDHHFNFWYLIRLLILFFFALMGSQLLKYFDVLWSWRVIFFQIQSSFFPFNSVCSVFKHLLRSHLFQWRGTKALAAFYIPCSALAASQRGLRTGLGREMPVDELFSTWQKTLEVNWEYWTSQSLTAVRRSWSLSYLFFFSPHLFPHSAVGSHLW